MKNLKSLAIFILLMAVVFMVFLVIKDDEQNKVKNKQDNTNELIVKKDMKSISPNIMVVDVNASVKYYEDKLGFVVVMVVDEENGDGKSGKPLVWAMLSKGDINIMLQRTDNFVGELPEMDGKAIGGTFTMYISMQNVKSFYKKVKDEVEIVKELHKTFYGADEFAIKDLNGYILYFAEAQDK